MSRKILDGTSLRTLIAQGEKLNVEFKSEPHQRLSDSDLIDTVVCLANSRSDYDRAYLLLGVADDGSVTGARPRHHAGTDPSQLQAMIFNRTEPPLSTEVSVHELHEGTVIAIEIVRHPVIYATKSGKILHRVMSINGPECQPLYPHQFHGFRSTFGLVDYSAQPLEFVRWNDLDPIEIERLRQTIERLSGDSPLTNLSDTDLLKALGLISTRGDELIPNVAGLLLVGRLDAITRVLPNHVVAFQVIGHGGEIVVNDALSGTLLRTLEDLMSRFAARNTEHEMVSGPFRLPIPDYAPDAFREAVSNAIVHRDYSENNSVYVQWHPDRLLITNPGGFPYGITLENLLVHEPTPRNPRLADVFRRIGLIERTGRGVDKIYEGQLRYGRPVPDYSQSDSSSVSVVLSGEGASIELTRFVFEQRGLGRLVGLDELLLLDHLRRERRTSTARAAMVIQKSEYLARGVLERLVEWGIAEARGERRGRVYLLSAPMYRTLGESAGYVRSRGFDRIQQEAMIVEFIKAHGKIRRVDVSELCALPPKEATRMLTNMVERKTLIREGSHRGTYYILDLNTDET